MPMRDNLLSFLDDADRRGSERAFVSRTGLRTEAWTYSDLRQRSFQLARELEKLGVSKGDRVIVKAENGPWWIAIFFGTLLRGAILVPLDEGSTDDFLQRVQIQVDARLVISSHRVPLAAHISQVLFAELTASALLQPSSDCPYPDSSRSDIAEIIFTSGTTAQPKGVCLTHQNILVNLEPIEREMTKYLKWERFFHPIRFLTPPASQSRIRSIPMGMFIPQLLGGEVFFPGTHNPSEIISTTRINRDLSDSRRSKNDRIAAVEGGTGCRAARGRASEVHRANEEG